MFQKTTMAAAIAISTSMLLVACGGSNGDNNGAVISSGPATGALQGTPTTTASLTAAQLATSAVAPPCGVTVSHIVYSTVGAAGESTMASGALMVPTGCTGTASTANHPVVLYAHGTTTSQSFNMANFVDPTNAAKDEGSLVAATFAANGYIVIAPNYVGYDLPTSGSGSTTLPYHPYVNYKQQSQEMINALKAGREALPTGADSGKLFVTGYSEGGYVAMATLKAMDVAHIPVTAGAPMSGPYSLAAYGDLIFSGNTPIGGTLFAPLLTFGYQKAYGNSIYGKASAETSALPTDVYNGQYGINYTNFIPTPFSLFELLDPTNPLSLKYLPPLALFQSVTVSGVQIDPITQLALTSSNSFGFDPTNYLISTAYRGAYLQDAQANPDGLVATPTTNPLPAANPQNPLRKAFKLNDLRGYLPSMPMLMCGGHSDPTVFYTPNTQVMAGIMGKVAQSGVPVAFAEIDVDTLTPLLPSTQPMIPAIGLNTAAITNLTASAQTTFLGTVAVTVAVATPTGKAAYVNALAGGASQAAAGSAAVTAIGGPAGVQAILGTPSGQQLLLAKYHGSLVPQACTSAAQQFFKQYL